jgi:small subunit ribosomal protein S6
MQTYETIFVTTPILTDDEEKTTVDAMAQIVADGGGNMVTNDRMGRRRLAYPIQKHNDGVYIRFLYDADSEIPKELERKLRLSDRILRSLTIRMEPKWAIASKEQAVKDAQERIEAAEREKAEKAEAERLAALAPPPSEDDGEAGEAGVAAATGVEAPAAVEPAEATETKDEVTE